MNPQQRRNELTDYLASAFRFAQAETGMCPDLEDTIILISHVNLIDDYKDLIGIRVMYAPIGSFGFTIAINNDWCMTDITRFIERFNEYLELYPEP